MVSLLKRLMNINMNTINKNKTTIVVLGATGTGKSKLAIEIAKKYNGEVINADSMQIYQGLDIATNKVSKEEQRAVPHHMLDFQDPLKSYNVVNFRNDVLPIIERIHSNGKLPVIVGGTHYYIEAILWNILVQSHHYESMDNETELCFSNVRLLERINFIKSFIISNISDKDVHNLLNVLNSITNVKCTNNFDSLTPDKNGKKTHYKDCTCNLNFVVETVIKLLKLLKNNNLLKLLEEIDPEIANTYHPNNTRKILRSVEVWIQTGECHSKHIRKQLEEVGKVDLGGKIRFQNTALLWITCNQEILDKRLDERVDAMIEQGLLRELSEFRNLYGSLLSKFHNKDWSKDSLNFLKVETLDKPGIFQCIGFKEFLDYLELDENDRFSEEGRNKYRKSLEMMKLRTRQYSRRQLRWIQNRFLKRNRMKIPVYTVDGTNLSSWKENVSIVADEIVKSILNDKKPSTSPIEVQIGDKNSTFYLGDKTRYFCDVCSRVIIGSRQWNDHLSGSKHRKMLKRNNSKEKDSPKVQKVS